MEITHSQTGAWVVLALAGNLDTTGSEELEAVLLPLVNGSPVALDFSGVGYVTSAGFRTLMIALKQQTASQGTLVLGGMSAPVRRFFDIAGLGRVFKIVDELSAIVSAV